MSRARAPIVEVCRPSQAVWVAPGSVAAGFDWVWRVVGANGNTVTGACNGRKSVAAKAARATARRMRQLSCGDTSVYQFRVTVPQDV